LFADYRSSEIEKDGIPYDTSIPYQMNTMADQMSNFNLVLSCLRPKPALCPTERIRTAIMNEPDWEQLNQIVTLHSMLPLFLHNLSSVGGHLLPPDLNAHIEQFFRVAQGHYRIQLKELGRIVQLLEKNNIPSIVIKGRTLGAEAYGDPVLRRSIDFDILIPKSKLHAAEHLLISDGYIPFEKIKILNRIQKRMHLWLSKQYPFQRYNGFFNLDLHFCVMSPGYHYPATFNDFWSYSKILTIEDLELRTLVPEELLILLSYHGVKNQWHSLKYVCDIAALLESHPDLNWETVISRAEENRCRRFLLVGLSLANRLLETKLPMKINEKIQNDIWVQKVVTALIDILRIRHEGRRFSYRERVWFHLATREDYRDKFRYIFTSFLANIWSYIYQNNLKTS